MKTTIYKFEFNSLLPSGKNLIAFIILYFAIGSSIIAQNSYSQKNTINKRNFMVSTYSEATLVKYPIAGKKLNRKYLEGYDKIEKFSEVEPLITYTNIFVPKVNSYTISKIDGEYLKKYGKIENFPEVETLLTYTNNFASNVNRFTKSKINGEYLKKYDKIEKFSEVGPQVAYTNNFVIKQNPLACLKIIGEYLKQYNKKEKLPATGITYND